MIAKLDRLGRNVAFISGLMESGVPFDCADRPGADPFRLHIEAAIAEEEARKISQRTREALRAAKRRGVLLGASRPECRNLTDKARRRGAKATQAMARAYYADVIDEIREQSGSGGHVGSHCGRIERGGQGDNAGLALHGRCRATAVGAVRQRDNAKRPGFSGLFHARKSKRRALTVRREGHDSAKEKPDAMTGLAKSIRANQDE